MLSSSVVSIKGIGPKRADILASELDITTVEDLLFFKPRRYIDRSARMEIIDTDIDEEITVYGKILSTKIVPSRKPFLEVEITDGTALLYCIFFGGVNYFHKLFTAGESVLFSGKVSFRNKRRQMVHPDFDFIDDENDSGINTGRIVPVYRSSEALKAAGFTSRSFRKIIYAAMEQFLDTVRDPFDESFLNDHELISLRDAVKLLHFPENPGDNLRAIHRISFNELYLVLYYIAFARKKNRTQRISKTITYDKSKLDRVIQSLPFELTADQLTSMNEIAYDINSGFIMNRLLQGDVGSGKTVIAALACFIIKLCSWQCAIMAPTEILAGQHYATFKRLLGDTCTIELITSSTNKKSRSIILENLKNGSLDIIIGTHSLIQDDVSFKDLRLVIIDEQHRFGVTQRAALSAKGDNPHMLVMTATPIPRSLALTLYGDLDISYIKTKPAGRAQIKTLSFPESKINGVYNSIYKYVNEGKQCYIVLPLIEESEKSDLKSAIELYEILCNKIFPDIPIGLLHGKMKQNEKETVMKRFSSNDIKILVTTTVVEVGVDVPNATIMVIYHAERFGLSQLHQLRGRVGRGKHQSYCILIHPDRISPVSRERVEVLLSTADGFIIAEKDLELRGAGDLMGAKQSGFAESFEFADLSGNIHFVEKIKLAAEKDAEKHFSRKQESLEARELIESLGEKGFRIKKIFSILS